MAEAKIEHVQGGGTVKVLRGIEYYAAGLGFSPAGLKGKGIDSLLIRHGFDGRFMLEFSYTDLTGLFGINAWLTWERDAGGRLLWEWPDMVMLASVNGSGYPYMNVGGGVFREMLSRLDMLDGRLSGKDYMMHMENWYNMSVLSAL